MSSLNQLSRQISYIIYEIKQLIENQGIKTINDIEGDEDNNFAITGGDNISITVTDNGIDIDNDLIGRTVNGATTYGLNAGGGGGSFFTCIGENTGSTYAGLYSVSIGFNAGVSASNFSVNVGSHSRFFWQ